MRAPGTKMRVMFGPKFCKSALASKADKFEVQKLEEKKIVNNLILIYSTKFSNLRL